MKFIIVPIEDMKAMFTEQELSTMRKSIDGTKVIVHEEVLIDKRNTLGLSILPSEDTGIIEWTYPTYTPNSNDKMAKPDLKKTMPKQLPNTCVTSIMDYIDDNFCGNLSNEGDYTTDYANWKNVHVFRDGVDIGDIAEFVNRHFNTKEFNSFKEAIDNGYVILTCIKSLVDNSVHNVLIIGYRDDNSGIYIYMDPEKGTLQEAPASSFLNLYNVSVSSCK